MIFTASIRFPGYSSIDSSSPHDGVEGRGPAQLVQAISSAPSSALPIVRRQAHDRRVARRPSICSNSLGEFFPGCSMPCAALSAYRAAPTMSSLANITPSLVNSHWRSHSWTWAGCWFRKASRNSCHGIIEISICKSFQPV